MCASFRGKLLTSWKVNAFFYVLLRNLKLLFCPPVRQHHHHHHHHHQLSIMMPSLESLAGLRTHDRCPSHPSQTAAYPWVLEDSVSHHTPPSTCQERNTHTHTHTHTHTQFPYVCVFVRICVSVTFQATEALSSWYPSRLHGDKLCACVCVCARACVRVCVCCFLTHEEFSISVP